MHLLIVEQSQRLARLCIAFLQPCFASDKNHPCPISWCHKSSQPCCVFLSKHPCPTRRFLGYSTHPINVGYSADISESRDRVHCGMGLLRTLPLCLHSLSQQVSKDVCSLLWMEQRSCATPPRPSTRRHWPIPTWCWSECVRASTFSSTINGTHPHGVSSRPRLSPCLSSRRSSSVVTVVDGFTAALK